MALLFRFHYGQTPVHGHSSRNSFRYIIYIYTSQLSHGLSNKTWILLCPRALFLLGGHVCELPLSVRIIPFTWVDFEVVFRFVGPRVSNCRTSRLGMRPDETFHLDPDTDTDTQLSWYISDTYVFVVWSHEVSCSHFTHEPHQQSCL